MGTDEDDIAVRRMMKQVGAANRAEIAGKTGAVVAEFLGVVIAFFTYGFLRHSGVGGFVAGVFWISVIIYVPYLAYRKRFFLHSKRLAVTKSNRRVFGGIAIASGLIVGAYLMAIFANGESQGTIDERPVATNEELSTVPATIPPPPSPPTWTEADANIWCARARTCIREPGSCNFRPLVAELPEEAHELRDRCIEQVVRDSVAKGKRWEREQEWVMAWGIWNVLANLTGEGDKYIAKAKRIEKRAERKRRKDAIRAEKKARRLAIKAEKEARRLAKKAEKERRREAMRVATAAMRSPTVASNGMAISIGKVKLRKGLGNTYFKGKEWRYLLTYIYARNTSSGQMYISANDFTVTFCSTDTGYDVKTYGLNYLDAVTLQPGSGTSGWLAFGVDRTCPLRLNYNMWGGQSMQKVIVVP